MLVHSARVGREGSSQKGSEIDRQKSRPDESPQDKYRCQQGAPNQAVTAMSTSAAAHPYQASIRVVHNYLPIKFRVGPGETITSPANPVPMASTLPVMTMQVNSSLVPIKVTH